MNTSLPWCRWFGKQTHRLLALSMLAVLAGYSGATQAAEPATCQSPNPADWPAPARPFFMIAFDTSGSMAACTNNTYALPGSIGTCNGSTPTSVYNSCNLPPTRINDGKCAVRKMVQAFGEVDFGLSSFPSANNCSANTGVSCGPYTNIDGAPPEYSGASNRCSLFTRAGSIDCPLTPGTGGKVLVGLPILSNQVAQIVKFTDDVCQSGDPEELLPVGGTPLAGLVSDTGNYLKTNIPPNWQSCRPVNVILITDGGESCANDGLNAPIAPIQNLYNGVTLPGRKVKVFPIGFGALANNEKAALEAMADAGQCDSSDNTCKAKVEALYANNEQELSIALSKIITGAIQPETCDNVDNNCNGCTDEGFKHYCNRNTQAGVECCNWSNQTSRNSCLTKFAQSGNKKDLPCWNPASTPGGLQPEQAWLCVDPGDVCDEKDNNCDVTIDSSKLNTNTVDENQLKCGSPLKCPAATDTCIPGSTLGVDDNCDGIVDNKPGSSSPGSACPNNCVPSTEVCDGKDNNCNGLIDDGVPDIPCGPPAGPGTALNCQGFLKCQGGSYSNQCNVNPQPEICDGLDNDCNGKIDDGAPPEVCIPPHLKGKGIKFQEDGFANSQCKKGFKPCGAPDSMCGNYVGPSEEICDGIDNDCDGDVDEGNLPGVGAPCGKNQGACTPGQRACVGGVFICQGGVQPQPELCNGVDDDCDGIPDSQETVFDDAPPPDKSGCWTGLDTDTCAPENLCTNPVNGPDWCKPAGADCADVGTLTTPCVTGTLSCQNTSSGYAYICKGGLVPSPEKCDGADNDCNGSVDDGLQIDPKPCQTACGEGTEVCADGKITCSAPTPKPEICNNIDDDCNGKIDDGVTEACSTECGSGVQVCKDGVLGPCTAPEKQAEVCDGLDNDCDGKIDENEDLDGTADPLDPSKVVGQPCGSNQGECKQGTWKCVTGGVKCVGAITPQTEVCDGKDNDCDGVIDNDSTNNALCDKAANQECVKTSEGAQCASRCSAGEFPCPAGSYICQSTTTSGATPTQGNFCVKPSNCKACETQTVKQVVNGKEIVLCAPSYEPGATPVPVCTCKNDKCSPPCAGVLCDTPLVCTDFGTQPGSCVDKSCFTVPCANGGVCNGKGECVSNPCKPDSCKPGEACKPSQDLSTAECFKSCVGVQCKDGESCVEGACKPTQCPKEGCETGKVCDVAKGECVDVTCKGCKAGQVCDPTTGQCTAGLCDGVQCPSGQRCEDGQCFDSASNAGGAGGSGGSGGGTTAGSGGSTTAGSGGSTTAGSSGNATGGSATGGSTANNSTSATTPIGLTTGGGGCTCSTGVGTSTGAFGSLSLLVAAFPLLRRRGRSGKKAS